MEYKSYQHIERLGTDAVEGILDGTVYVFTKLDGSCGEIYLKDDGTVGVGSRNRQLDICNDNQGCCAYIMSQEKYKKYLEKHPNHRVFGEWLVKHTVKTYEDDAWRKFYVFDVIEYDEEGTYRYLSYEEYVPLLEEFGIEYIPVIKILDHPIEEEVRALQDECLFLQKEGYIGEGCFGRNTRILMADGTYKKIVDVAVGDYVKSYNVNTKTIENKKVLNVFNNGVKPFEDWFHVTVNQKKLGTVDKAFDITKNHKIYNGKNFIDIESSIYAYMYEQVPDNYIKQALLGILCSDGCYHRRKHTRSISISQVKDKSNDWMRTLDGFITDSYEHMSGKGSKIITYNVIAKYIDYIIGNYETKSGLDFISIFNDLDNIGWAYMFMGDGTSHGYGTLAICLSSYTQVEVETILDIFNKKFNCSAWLYFDKRVSGGSGAVLRMNKTDAKKFVDCIGRYITPAYRYKLRDYTDVVYDDFHVYKPTYALVKRRIYNKAEEKDMSRAKSGRYKGIYAYDLEVEDNHNYFAENMLVHNCVAKNYQYKNKYGRTTWAKVVRQQFKVAHKVKRVIDGSNIEQSIVNEFCTAEFVEKEFAKIVNENNGCWESKLIGKLLGVVWHTFIVEECWNIIKKYKNPKIDFKVLQGLVTAKIKEVKQDVF